ncbi:MAG: hypothetical protein A2X86_09745 [Bdellovibrionales bacterium GWA2_49_15]|nr:MAG: hypothetical protein A2X86_09745 [Bdellovibrionales bacterium GWA2_49_15]HAZ13065.1 peptidase U32 [Bdellovibrionales bacterium]
MNFSFSVATNFDSTLVDRLKQFPVVELYGKLPSDYVGGGRSSYMLNQISRRKLADHVAYVRKAGLGFNYLLNAACLDNKEITTSGQKAIHRLLDWISKIGATAVTVSNPLLLRMIKQQYPHLKVRISVFAGVDHLRKAKYWEDQGADVICLDSQTVNREFRTLKTLRKSLTCGLELLVNNSCLQSCSLREPHMNLLAHSSQRGHSSGGFVIDHCIMECSRMKLEEPVNMIRADWIRPEDLKHYVEMGFDRFKIVERNLPTDIMVSRVQAYTEGRYEGNLLDLVQPYGQSKASQSDSRGGLSKKMLRSLFFLFRPFRVKIWRLLPFQELARERGMLQELSGPPPIYIDNRKLDGFIDRFLTKGCRDVVCEECRHCHNYAERAITINSAHQQKCVGLHKKIETDLRTSKLWL